MELTEEQKTAINQYLTAKNLLGLVYIISNLDDQQDEKFIATLDIISKLDRGGKLTASNIAKLAEVVDNHRAAPSGALEGAYDAFFEQAGGLGSITHNAASNEATNTHSILEQVMNLSADEQIATIAKSLTVSEIDVEIHRIKQALEPGILTHNIDQNLINQLDLFRAAHRLQAAKDNASSDNVAVHIGANLAEIETRKSVRVVPGFGVLEELQKLYLQSLPNGGAPSPEAERIFLEDHKLMSRGEGDNGLTIDEPQNILVNAIRKNITSKPPIQAQDIWGEVDVEYVFNKDQKIREHKVDDE